MGSYFVGNNNELKATHKRVVSDCCVEAGVPASKSASLTEYASQNTMKLLRRISATKSCDPRSISAARLPLSNKTARIPFANYTASRAGDHTRMSSEHCIRGLEHVVTPRAATAHKKSLKERIFAVLFQQQLQRETATSNPELPEMISSCAPNEMRRSCANGNSGFQSLDGRRILATAQKNTNGFHPVVV